MTLFATTKLKNSLSKWELLWGAFAFGMFLLALVSSQSGMDFFSGVMFLTLLYWTARHWKADWQWPRLGLKYLWLVWLAAILLGLYLSPSAEARDPKYFLEYRWILELHIFVLYLALFGEDRRMIKSFAIIFATASALAIIFYFIGWNFLTQDYSVRAENMANFSSYRAGGLFDHAMPLAHSYGPLLLVFVGLAAYQVKSRIKVSRWVYLTIALATVTLLLTFTRGVWIGAGVGLIAMAFFLNRKWGFATVAALACVGFIGMATSEKIRHRVMETVSRTNQGDQERITIWKANWEMFKDHPVFGVGYGQNRLMLREYYDRLGVPAGQFEGHAHNEYIHLLSGTGVVGLACYLFLIAFTFRAALCAFKNSTDVTDKGLSLGLIGAFVCFHVGALTEANFAIGKNRFMIILLMAWAIWLCYKPQKTAKNAV